MIGRSERLRGGRYLRCYFTLIFRVELNDGLLTQTNIIVGQIVAFFDTISYLITAVNSFISLQVIVTILSAI